MDNEVFRPGYSLSVVVTNPTTPVSGDPVRFGKMTGIAETDEGGGGNPATKTSVYFGPIVVDVVVDDNEGTGIAVGDLLYYHDTGTGTGSVHLNNSPTGADAFFGTAMEVVTANATTLINVRHVDSGFTSPTGVTTDTAQLVDNAVTAAKLAGALKTGFIPLPLVGWREIATNDIPVVGTPDGGLLSSDTTPALARINGATDKALRLSWVSSNSDEITHDITYPPDLDDGAAVEVHILAKMASGGMDTPLIAVGYFEGVGDTNAGGNTAALSVTLAEVTVAIAAGNVGVAPKAASISLTPAAHTNEALEIYGIWVEYSRKGN